MADRPLIEERENGPLIVKYAKRMVGSDGSEMEVKEVMALCRCGSSKNKPFCDGTHKEVGFESRGGQPAGKDKVYSYKGKSLTVQYNPLICSHAAECVRLAPPAFNPNRKPWIEPDNVAEDDVRDVVRACPSGALSIEGEGHLFADRADVTVQKDGPYWVCGADLPVEKPGENGTSEKVVLCRCGLSGNKPFCDGSHRDKGWSDEG